MPAMEIPDIQQSKYRVLEQRALLPFLLCLTVALVYGGIFKYPFIQDDWYIFDSVRSLGSGGFLLRAFTPAENFFYRPVAQPYFLLVYKLFFPDPTVMHGIALIIHALNSIIIVRIVAKLIQNDLVAWSTGFLYAAAVTIHMDSLLWMVGIYDLIGSMFFFLSILLVMNGRFTSSFAVFVLALLTKESTIILLPVLFLVTSIQFSKSNPWKHSLRLSFSVLWMHLIVFLMYLGMRMNFIITFPVSTENPYVMNFSIGTVLDNGILALRWYGEGISPYLIAGGGTIIAVGMLIAIIVLTRVAKLSPRMTVVLWGWIILGILPVLFLEKHFFRYYLTYSFVPVLVIVVLGIQNALVTLFRGRAITGILAVVVVGMVISSGIYFSDLNARGHAIPTMDGSNNLIRKGAVSTMVHDFLMQRYPEVPHGTVFLFNWLPTIAFGKEIGPQFWYGDTSLHVFEIQEIKRSDHGLYPIGSTDRNSGGDFLDSVKMIYLEFHGDRLREVDAKHFFEKDYR